MKKKNLFDGMIIEEEKIKEKMEEIFKYSYNYLKKNDGKMIKYSISKLLKTHYCLSKKLNRIYIEMSIISAYAAFRSGEKLKTKKNFDDYFDNYLRSSNFFVINEIGFEIYNIISLFIDQ